MVLLAAVSLSTFVFTADPKGDLSVSSIQVYALRLASLLSGSRHRRFPGNARRYANKNQDFAFVNFNLTAGTTSHPSSSLGPFSHYILDLTPLFNWNTKQLFLYVSAEYENKRGVSPRRPSVYSPN